MLTGPCWDVLSDMISVDGQLAVTAIDHYRQLNGARSTKVTESVQRSPHRTSGVEHIIDQSDRAAVHIDG